MAQLSVRQRQDQSSSLFNYFIQGRIQEEAPHLVAHLSNIVAKGWGVPADLRQVAQSLTQLAVDFANSPQRQKVKEAAMQQGLNITPEQLTDLLQMMLDPNRHEELQERIIVALFFCFDCLMRLATLGIQKMRDFLVWCRDSFVRVLDPVVSAAGGWNKIMVGAAAAGIFFTAAAIIAGVGLLIGKVLMSR